VKYEQEFRVPENIATVWEFFEQFERVAQCIPGVQKAEVHDADNLTVVVTQRLGPMTATFEAKVQITDRITCQKIEFASTGKAIRGAIGNFRSTSTVLLREEDGQTQVSVAGDVALGGALGSVGQKVIAKQAEKATAEFSRNLEAVLLGKAPEAAAVGGDPDEPRSAAREASVPGAVLPAAASVAAMPVAGDGWSKLSAVLSGAALLVSLAVLWRVS